MNVMTGLDRVANGEIDFHGIRASLLAHPASVSREVKHAYEILTACETINIVSLMGPQHGWFGDTQDNMIEWEGEDYSASLPLYSLYGEHREPTEEMLENIDAIIVDLQDVGCRVYTFLQTLYLVMKAANQFNKKVIVLDRPNPIGNRQEGPWLSPDFFTFVGLQPIALRHGFTMAELATAFQKDYPCEMEYVTMRGYSPGSYFDETGCPWVLPSPNMPTLDTAIVYPGTVLFEATNVSEGRGTTKPFEMIGSPTVDASGLEAYLKARDLPGVAFRKLAFEPTFHKFKDQLCQGLQVHVQDRTLFCPVLTGFVLINGFRRYDPSFEWLAPPYEYEYDKMPIDILAGDNTLRECIDQGASLSQLTGLLENQSAVSKSWDEKVTRLYS